MFISNNLFLLNSLNNVNSQMTQVMNQLSTGLRINSAADDAAGLSVATRMTAQINGLNVANQNVNAGLSLTQTADGAEQSINGILQQMNALAQQAANGTLSSTDTQNIQTQINSLSSEIDHISQTTTFNGISLLYPNGGAAQGIVTLHISDQANDTMTMAVYNSGLTALGINNLDVVNNASAAISAINAAINSVSNIRASYGAVEERLNFTISNINTETQNLNNSLSQIQDANTAQLTSQLTKDQIQQQENVSLLNTFNQNQQAILKLFS